MVDAERDPEAMLARLRTEEPEVLADGAPKRGRLKIFFGYAAGVGKTFAMLDAARAARANGRDVVLGYIEPHGRSETDALMHGMESLPARIIEYRRVGLKEFDLDAVLRRRPELVLVDELAHTNAPGCRHLKRWQDVEELVAAGVEVWTTLNVQHIESLNDIVARFTGIVVRETLPDSAFDGADEVELVDLPPDELLERLREGKVYVADQAASAVDSFFRKPNLIALRELALRRMADRLRDEVQTARRGRTRTVTWPTSERLLVCVGASPTSGKVIRTAKRMASAMHAQWIAVHLESASADQVEDGARDRVARHLKLAEGLGAETVTISGEDLAEEIVEYAQARNVTKIVVGKTGEAPRFRFWKRSAVDRLIARSGDIDVYVIRGVEEKTGPPPPPPVPKRWSWRPYLSAAAVLAAGTLVALGVDRFGLTDANIVMTYLLAVVLVAAWAGRGPAIAASVVAVLLFNFFFTPPYHTFTVNDSQYILTFGVMMAVSLMVSTMTTRIRNQARLARERARRTDVQYHVSHSLANAVGMMQIAIATEQELATTFGGEFALFVAEDGAIRPLVYRGGGFTAVPTELEAAKWVFEHGQVAGCCTDTLPNCQATYIPLHGAGGPVGVLAWLPLRSSDFGDNDRRQFLESICNQIALALERDRLSREAERILAEAEAERQRSSLLSAVSHDLRTPLTAIAGSAGALLDRRLDIETRDELARSIAEESDRLSRLVENLLNLTRLESGSMNVNRMWQPLDEVVGSSLHRVESALRTHPVETSIPADIGLVAIDGLLIEQLLVNLLDNVAKYMPPGSPVTIAAVRAPGCVEVSVADRGPGLAADEGERVFDRFYRGSRTAGDRGRGAGLGLAICRAIAEIHGGRIWVESREGGGTRFVFTIPRATAGPVGDGTDGKVGDEIDA